MTRWFRFYDDAINDPKALKLSDKTYRIWVGILCIASKNDGALPSFEDMAIMLRMKAEKLQPELEKLIAAELIDHDDDGLRPHNWNTRQYKSDVSNERVQRHRERQRNVTPAVTVTPPETEADTETKSEKKDIRAVAKATRPAGGEAFDEFWKAYPKRDGANPKAPAQKIFAAAVKSGHDPTAITSGARRYAEALRGKGQVGTAYVAQALTWLRQARWEDYPEGGELIAGEVQMPGVYVAFDTPEHDAWASHERATGKSFPRDRSGGWHFPSQWPPGFGAMNEAMKQEELGQ